MRDIRYQYFLTFAVLGTVLPYASVFFRQSGLSDPQVGYAYAIWSLAAMLSPVLVTLVADSRADPRGLLVLGSLLTAASLLALGFVHGVRPILCVWSVYCAAYMPILPLQDGIHFSLQQCRRARGQAPVPYHLVRVWGTIGFIVPGVLLFALLAAGMSLRAMLMTGAAFAVLAALQAWRIHDPRGSSSRESRTAARQLPTLDAARALLRPRIVFFCAAVLLMQMAAAVHSAFYPVYLTEKVGLADKWLGQVSNLAVVIEACLIFACGWLVRTLGTRRLLIIAILATALRFGLLALFTTMWIAIGTQVLHGLLIVATGVLPQALLDEGAQDGFRHSTQGMLAMLMNAGRSGISLAAGPVAAWSLRGLWAGGAGLCLLAVVLILIGFEETGTTAPDVPTSIPVDEPLLPPLVPSPIN